MNLNITQAKLRLICLIKIACLILNNKYCAIFSILNLVLLEFNYKFKFDD